MSAANRPVVGVENFEVTGDAEGTVIILSFDVNDVVLPQDGPLTAESAWHVADNAAGVKVTVEPDSGERTMFIDLASRRIKLLVPPNEGEREVYRAVTGEVAGREKVFVLGLTEDMNVFDVEAPVVAVA